MATDAQIVPTLARPHRYEGDDVRRAQAAEARQPVQ
jgi:hypothetical protein